MEEIHDLQRLVVSDVNQRSAVNGQWLVFLSLVYCLLVNSSVTNIQNPAAFVKYFGRFSGVVKEENYQLLGEKKLCE